jgi:hypothetical protein
MAVQDMSWIIDIADSKLIPYTLFLKCEQHLVLSLNKRDVS